MYGTENPHYYYQEIREGPIEFHPQNINLFVVSDAFWVCSPNGCQFVKDVSTKF